MNDLLDMELDLHTDRSSLGQSAIKYERRPTEFVNAVFYDGSNYEEVMEVLYLHDIVTTRYNFELLSDDYRGEGIIVKLDTTKLNKEMGMYYWEDWKQWRRNKSNERKLFIYRNSYILRYPTGKVDIMRSDLFELLYRESK